METVEIKIPEMGESIKEALISSWYKKEGDVVARDEPVCEIETDKVTVEVYSPSSGVIKSIKTPQGQTARVGEVVALLELTANAPVEASAKTAPEKQQTGNAPKHKEEKARPKQTEKLEQNIQELSPAVRKLAADKGIDTNNIHGTGKHGRLTKGDLLAFKGDHSSVAAQNVPLANEQSDPSETEKAESVVPMTPIRKSIASRLVQAQAQAAILTTFNEVDMHHVMELRKHYQEEFQKRHGVKLGFMGFFTRAVISALEKFPALNARIEGDNIIYHHYYNIGIAVGGSKGLVVPVIKNAGEKSLAEIEQAIAALAKKVHDSKISLDDLQGGTFSITNGGIYGSMLSTPILNYPQSGILGLHNIVKRPVVVNDEIVIRPVMYIALSYDHRMVDGKEAVQFLVDIKDTIENPEKLLLNI